jgi:transcription antitermination factor NusG
MSPNEWFAAYTYPKHEKKAQTYLNERGVETFLPVYRESHLWKNGVRSIVEIPLFAGYLFVHIRAAEKLKVLQTPSIASLVGTAGIPTPIDDEEVASLRKSALISSSRPHPYLCAGDRVRIKSGPLAGMEGALVSFKNHWRLVIAMELLRQAISVEVDIGDVERLCSARPKATA